MAPITSLQTPLNLTIIAHYLLDARSELREVELIEA
jgi:hypothetical protein